MSYVGEKKEGEVLCNGCMYEPEWEKCEENWSKDSINIEKYGECGFDKMYIFVAGEDCFERAYSSKALKIERCCSKIEKK